MASGDTFCQWRGLWSSIGSSRPGGMTDECCPHLASPPPSPLYCRRTAQLDQALEGRVARIEQYSVAVIVLQVGNVLPALRLLTVVPSLPHDRCRY